MFHKLVLVPVFAVVMGVALGCSPGGNTSGSGTGGDGGASTSTGGVDASAGAGATVCECDDGFACTIDRCDGEGCVHTIGPDEGDTACPDGQYCTLEDGCVDAPACADDADCEDFFGDDACKTGLACEAASSLCTFDVLDKDGDGDPPQVCGGGDCDDDDSTRYVGNDEQCDGVDNDCDGEVDEDADGDCGLRVLGQLVYGLQECVGGECRCKEENLCGESCTDKETDPGDCGECGNRCPQGAACVGGECQPCDDDEVLCHDSSVSAGETVEFNICADLATSERHCGACGNVCPTGADCIEGMCTCDAEQIACDGACTYFAEDDSNCGACGNVCEIGYTCIDGICACVLNALNRLVGTECDGVCVDTASDVQHCGGCGNECASGATCINGACDCGSPTSAPCPSPDGPVCMWLDADESNCGACGNVCEPPTICIGGECGCVDDLELCEGDCVDVLSDPQNCGSCGTECSSNQICGDPVNGPLGACIDCAAGTTPCDNYCTDLATDSWNCGACGHECNGECEGGECPNGECMPLGELCSASSRCCRGTICIQQQGEAARCE